MGRSRWIALGVFLVLTILNIAPVIWGVLTSLKSPQDVLAYPPKVFGFEPTLQHYQRLWDSGFLQALKISALYAGVTVLLGLVLGSVAAYGFDRYEFRFRRLLFLLVVSSIPLSIGAAALVIPNYLYLTYLNLTNKWFTLPIIYTAYNLPMAIWIIKGSIEGIPRELDEAALLDGATPLGVVWRIVIPLSRPALGAAGMFLFIGAWNNFVSSSVMVDSSALRPVQVAIYQYIGYFGREWGPLTASAIVAIIPIVVVFAFLGRFLVSGLSQGAVKG